MGVPTPIYKQDTVPFSIISDSNGILDSASLVEDCCGDIASPLSMLETRLSNNGGSHMARTLHPSVAQLDDPQALMRYVMWHPELNDFLRVRSNTPADTIQGISSASATESSDLSFLYNAGDSHLKHSTPFDTELIQGIAGWSDELWTGDRQLPKTFSIHPRNEAEALSAVKKMLRACGKVPRDLICTTAKLPSAATSLVDDSFGAPNPSIAYARKPCLSRRRLSGTGHQTFFTSAPSKCPDKHAMNPAVAANSKGQFLSHRTGLQADVEAQEILVAYAGSSRTRHLNRNITTMLLVALFLGIAMRFSYWVMWASNKDVL